MVEGDEAAPRALSRRGGGGRAGQRETEMEIEEEANWSEDEDTRRSAPPTASSLDSPEVSRLDPLENPTWNSSLLETDQESLEPIPISSIPFLFVPLSLSPSPSLIHTGMRTSAIA